MSCLDGFVGVCGRIVNWSLRTRIPATGAGGGDLRRSLEIFQRSFGDRAGGQGPEVRGASVGFVGLVCQDVS